MATSLVLKRYFCRILRCLRACCAPGNPAVQLNNNNWNKNKITALTIQIAGVAAAESGHKLRFLAARKKPKSAMKMLADTEREEALNLVSFPIVKNALLVASPWQRHRSSSSNKNNNKRCQKKQHRKRLIGPLYVD